MKIFIDDGLQMTYKTGIGNYTSNLIKHLSKKNISLCVAQHKKFFHKNIFNRIKYIFDINFSKKYKNSYKECDFIHYTDYVMPYIREKGKCKFVVTIHDLVCFKYPDTLPFLYRTYIKFNIKYSMKNADIILTVSESIKNEITDIFPKYIEKVYVVPCGVSNKFKCLSNSEINEYTKKYIIPENFFLFVGVLEQRKNVKFLIKAFEYAKETKKILRDLNYKLVLVGKEGKGFKDIQSQIKNSKFRNDIITKGFIDFEELLLLYNKSKGFLYPSIYEGFGLPILESISCGSKILASKIPTNYEIAFEYALFYKNDDYISFAEQLINLINSSRNEERAKEILNFYDYDIIISKYVEVLQKYEN